jgi:DNA-binding protein H-NS
MRPYQFTLLRYVHNVSTEEFVNIGVLLWLPEEKKLFHCITDHYQRLSQFFDGFDGVGYKNMLRKLKKRIKEVSKPENSKSFEDLSDVLPAILIVESACFQWSSEMFGITNDAEQEVTKMFAEMIERHEKHLERKRREESDVTRAVAEQFRRSGIEDQLSKDVSIASHEYAYKFKFGWQNGKRQVLEPISFDYIKKDDVIEKANKWIGRLDGLKGEDFQLTGVVAAPQDSRLIEAFQQAIKRLEKAPHVRRILREDEVEGFIPEIKRDIATSSEH